MNVLTLAHELGKFEHEVLALHPNEFARHLAYLKIREKDSKSRSKA